MTVRTFGWIPDDRDDRDHFVSGRALSRSTIPQSRNLEHLLPPVLYQGRDGSCVAQSVATLIYAAHVRAKLEPELPSRKAIWWYGRAESGKQDHNAGMQIRTAMRLLNELGFCRERHWPHDKPLDRCPSVTSSRHSLDQRNRGEGRVVYERIDDAFAGKLVAIRAVVAAGYPVTFGVDVSESFASNAFDPTRAVDPPAPADVAGGHAMVCCGYSGGSFLIRNSWGADWGVVGSCWFSSTYMMTAADLWTVPVAPPFSDLP